jgi:serine protease Do
MKNQSAAQHPSTTKLCSRVLSALMLPALVLGTGNFLTARAADPEPSKPAGNALKPLPELKVDNTPLPSSAPTYAPIVEKVAPAVVTINTSQTARKTDPRNPLGNHPLFDDPMFRKFFGIPEDSPSQGPQPKQKGRRQEDAQPDGNAPQGRKREQTMPLGLGSGVVVSADGYILTNNHVIDGADKIEVSLGKNGKSFVAKKVGGDVRTDIAVLKIEATGLNAITFADSNQLRAGDIVVAVGSPFGLTRSATMGVVSAIGRNTQMSQLADLGNFIQTDAAINMGNSGGALVDYQGRLVGINTAIFSRTGGNQGIGFSVPSNMARSVMESLIRHGRVLRGFLGIGLQDLDEAMQKEFNVETGVGAVVTDVRPGTPAQRAGLREYDVITHVNGKKVEGMQDLRITVAGMLPGAKVSLQCIRERKSLEVVATLGENAEKGEAAPPVVEADPDVLDGVTVADLDDATRQEFKVPTGIKGALVTAVEQDSVAAASGIRPGDVIQEIKRRPIGSADEAVKMSEELKKEKQVLLRIYTRGSSRLVMLEAKP